MGTIAALFRPSAWRRSRRTPQASRRPVDLGRELIEQGRWADAIAMLQPAFAAEPHNVEIAHALARAHKAAGTTQQTCTARDILGPLMKRPDFPDLKKFTRSVSSLRVVTSETRSCSPTLV